MGESRLIDRFGREVSYIRVSVTDRCDFRCLYCMAEDMQFLPRAQILSLEEIYWVCQAFTELGVTKIRLTGGEPLVRRDVLTLVEQLGQLPGLNELVMTTNGSRLETTAADLRRYGVRRLNVSLDSLRPERFRDITRTGNLDQVLRGIDAARGVGFERIKLNVVIMKGRNDDEVGDLIDFARRNQLDICFIEEMPLGQVAHQRQETFCSSDEVRQIIQQRYELIPSSESSGGPARYYRLPGSSIRVGFISPHSHNFCHLCNRVRVTVEGRLLLCLGNEHSVDLRALLREYPGDLERLKQEIGAAMALKPERHHFDLSEQPQILRFMNMTGG